MNNIPLTPKAIFGIALYVAAIFVLVWLGIVVFG